MIVRLRWFYFLYYAGVGTFLSYFAPYLRGLGFSGEQIGWVTFAQQTVGAPAALVWGSLADRLGARPRALALCTAGMFLALSGLPFARTPAQVGLLLVLSALFSGAVVPLVDSTTVEAVKREPGHSYARTRLWGSIGFVVTAQGLGLLLAARGDRPADAAMPFAYLACIAGFTAVAQGFARAPEAKGASGQRPHWRDALALLRNPRLLLLLAICAIHWAACAPYHLLFGVLVRDHGLSSGVTGAGLSLGVLAEVLALLSFPALLRRFPVRALFAVAFAGSALRWALVGAAHGAVALVSLQLLHALSFGIWWGCAVEAMQQVVPVRLRATGQAIFSAVVFAGGNALGYALSGRGYDRFGSASPLYTWAGAVELLPLVLLLAPLSREKSNA
ncbi:MAG TPA: MFS transporter [Myxococcales bacterium]|nr:MFS transporter [Myxococcales bacterium]